MANPFRAPGQPGADISIIPQIRLPTEVSGFPGRGTEPPVDVSGLPGRETERPTADGTAVVGPWMANPRPKRRVLGMVLLALSAILFVLGIELAYYNTPTGPYLSTVYPDSVDAVVVVIFAVIALCFGLGFLFWVSRVPLAGPSQPEWMTTRCRNCGKSIDPAREACEACGAAVM